MAKQLDMFAGVRPFIQKPLVERDERQLSRDLDPCTSHEAGGKMVKRLGTIQRSVLSRFVLAGREGMTDLRLEAGASRSTLRTRRAELVSMGLLMDTGRRLIQEGSRRIVWAVTEEGKRRHLSEMDHG